MGIFYTWNALFSLLMLSKAAQTTFSVNRIIEFKLRWSNAKTPEISLPDSLDLKMLRNWRKPSENCKGQEVALWEKTLNFSRYFSVFFSWDFLSQTFSLIKCAWKVKRTSQVEGSIFFMESDLFEKSVHCFQDLNQTANDRKPRHEEC